MAARAGLLIALVLLSACAHARAQGHLTTIDPAQTPFPSYPIMDAFGKHADEVTPEQRAFIVRILHSRTYRNRRADLYFSPTFGARTPIVAYLYPLPVDKNTSPSYSPRVIGENCDIYFNAYDGLIISPNCPGDTPEPLNS